MANHYSTSTLDRRTILKASAGLGGALLVGAPWSPTQAATPLPPTLRSRSPSMPATKARGSCTATTSITWRPA
jgi:hypothetical protein